MIASYRDRDDFMAACVRASVRMITQTKRAGQAHADYDCPVCNAGTVHVQVRHNANGHITGSAGNCSTDGCMRWEE